MGCAESRNLRDKMLTVIKQLETAKNDNDILLANLEKCGDANNSIMKVLRCVKEYLEKEENIEGLYYLISDSKRFIGIKLIFKVQSEAAMECDFPSNEKNPKLGFPIPGFLDLKFVGIKIPTSRASEKIPSHSHLLVH